MRAALAYKVQYSQEKDRLWVHCSTGETVGRFSARFGMDIHRPVMEQIEEGGSQCLYCTHTRATAEDFELFCQKAFELWGVEIDQGQIVL